MEFRYLRYFVAVAEELHFTRAAERLGMAQPPLSQQIQKLEHEIGTKLFRRLTRGVELTEAGKLLYEDAQKILSLADLAKSRAQSAARGQTGRICIGIAHSVMLNALVAQLILAYRQAYPGVQLSLKEGPNTELIEDLRNKRIDAAILRQAPPELDSCKIEVLSSEETLLALEEQHPLAVYDTIELPLLVDQPLILFPRRLAPDLYDVVVSACEQAGFTPVLGQEATHLASTVSLVAAGLGISIVPRSIAQIHLAGVVYREIHPKPPSTQLMLAYRSAEHSAVVSEFIKVVRSKGRK